MLISIPHYTSSVINRNIPYSPGWRVQKRPARGPAKEKPFIGPPSSCKDLSQLGHTLNGISLVKTKSTSSNNPKIIDTVFCDFQPEDSGVVESKLGYVEVKIAESAGIYFKVQIGNRTTFPTKGVLRYDNQVSNAGGGMNLKTGIFTAPKAGVYIFSFSLLKEGFSFDHLTVSLRLNRTVIGGIGAGAAYYTNSATMQSVLKLKKGDHIDVWKSNGDLNPHCPNSCHHFTGMMIEEDLIK